MIEIGSQWLKNVENRFWDKNNDRMYLNKIKSYRIYLFIISSDNWHINTIKFNSKLVKTEENKVISYLSYIAKYHINTKV